MLDLESDCAWKYYNFHDGYGEERTNFGKNEKGVLMQFIGLLDTNDNEIYEGDILKIKCSWKDKGEAIHRVEYKEELYGGESLYFTKIKGDNVWDEDVEPTKGWIKKYCILKIIGNKYQNPELNLN